MSFVHLHVHSEYSLLDGAIRIKDLVSKTKELGMEAVALTDHGVMYGAVEFYKEAKANGIKPIIGSEVYMASRSRFDKDVNGGDAERGHLILLAKNNNGYKNLTKLVSLGFTEGFYYKPRIDKEILEKYRDDLVCLSACMAGEIPHAILDNNYEKAKELALYYNNLFGQGNFYLEMQSNGIQEQIKVNQGLIKISNETGIPLIVTNDCHYLTRDDYYSHEVLLCVQTGKKMSDEDRMSFSTNEFYLKSPEEMASKFKNFEEALNNTQKVADMCNVEFEFGNLKLPEFKVEGKDNYEYFKELCYKGLEKRYAGELTQDKYDRLEYEIGVIKQMGYVDYFLIVSDFISYAKNNGIQVGPGRGSAAGSMVAYVMEITDIDPLKYNLIFERFLNPERVSMPDIDIDFCYQRRQDVIDYVIEKYGSDHVAQIITFGTLAAKAVIRDVGRVLDISYAKTDFIAKSIPFEIGMTIEKALKMNPELRNLYETDDEVKRLIDISMSLEGLPRHASTHAAGVVITKDPVMDYVALYKNEDSVTTQFTMTTLEELGLLKMDFLGLRTLTVIRDALNFIKENYNVDIDFNKDEMSDPLVYKMIGDGKTEGIFQLESAGMKQFMRELKPESLEDIIAGISLYRPGPMDQIPRYIKNKKNPEHVEYTHKALEPILNVSYGCMIYQEQVMQIVRELAGYTLGHADLVRRAMAKKKADVMAKEREIFVNGCKERDIDENSANKIFDEMSDFAKYAFNKSHAAAYAVVAYRTAFLKAHYPAEFMAAMLNSFIGSLEKVPQYINECKKIGVQILKPDINESRSLFAVKNNAIRFGLAAVKNVGEAVINIICEERDTNGSFKSFMDFCKRTNGKGINKKCVESLIKCGAFECMNNRATLLNSFEKIIDGINQTQRNNIEGQFNLFEIHKEEIKQEEIRFVNEFPQKELLAMEKEMIGMYISGHPLDKYADIVSKEVTLTSLDLVENDEENQESKLKDDMEVVIGGIISTRRNKITKNNDTMAFLEVEDFYGKIDVIVFPKVLGIYNSIIKEDTPVFIKGRIKLKEDEPPTVICQNVKEIKLVRKLYLKIENELDEKVKEILKKSKGDNPVYVYYAQEKVTKIAPKELWSNLSEEVVGELKEILGEDNVKIVE